VVRKAHILGQYQVIALTYLRMKKNRQS